VKLEDSAQEVVLENLYYDVWNTERGPQT
jgi:hypothetical protein